ncbi:MAG: type 2 isopentenyl-diphosphate Delta-isomerase [Spirochaetales bacterium]|nr:type 2 isopentenyl-diphosphate Delta-isomerase [Spirochaetales bacterium]
MSTIKRKKDHIKLFIKSNYKKFNKDNRFDYEPLLNSHQENVKKVTFLGKEIDSPIFISSITGGTKYGGEINYRLLKIAKEFNLPIGLGSIRPFLENNNRKNYIGSHYIDHNLVFGNIGISQLEELRVSENIKTLQLALEDLNLYGLIIHINPLQEWVQPNGDRLKYSPLSTLEEILPMLNCKVIIKEVGCGFGPESIQKLLKLPIDALDTAGYGGTNFTYIEYLRNNIKNRSKYKPLLGIGNSNEDMLKILNQDSNTSKDIIFSGGIKNYLDGFYYINKYNGNSIYAYGGNILKQCLKSEKALYNFIEGEISGLNFANNFLKVKK